MTKIITFKSYPEYWRKEYLGLKRNTIRKMDDEDDVRFDILCDFIIGRGNFIELEIENTKTGESFLRKVTDVSKYEDWYIISW